MGVLTVHELAEGYYQGQYAVEGRPISELNVWLRGPMLGETAYGAWVGLGSVLSGMCAAGAATGAERRGNKKMQEQVWGRERAEGEDGMGGRESSGWQGAGNGDTSGRGSGMEMIRYTGDRGGPDGCVSADVAGKIGAASAESVQGDTNAPSRPRGRSSAFGSTVPGLGWLAGSISSLASYLTTSGTSRPAAKQPAEQSTSNEVLDSIRQNGMPRSESEKYQGHGHIPDDWPRGRSTCQTVIHKIKRNPGTATAVGVGVGIVGPALA